LAILLTTCANDRGIKGQRILDVSVSTTAIVVVVVIIVIVIVIVVIIVVIVALVALVVAPFGRNRANG